MAAGYAYGVVVKLDRARRRRATLWLGLSLFVAFVVIRATNLYGDPFPWSQQQSLLFTVFSFIKCEKYPPSLLYLLMTLGPAFIVLALLDRDPANSGNLSSFSAGYRSFFISFIFS